MRDAGDKSPSTTIDKVMTRSIFVTGLATNIANVSQRMIAEDFEMVPLSEATKPTRCRNTTRCHGKR